MGKLRLAMAIAALVTACGGAPTTPTTTFPLAGTWVGQIADNAGTGTLTLVLSQSGPGVSGTFVVTSNTAALVSSGTAGGTANGAALSLFLTPSAPLVCSPTLTLTGTVGASLTIAGRRMTGQYFVTSCGGGRAGTVDVTLQ